MSEPKSTGNPEGKKNEREVTDPITHLPILIHDEIERPPPYPAKSEDHDSGRSIEDIKWHETENSNESHTKMELLIDEEARRRWWHEPGDIERKTRVRDAIIAGGAVYFGAQGGILILWLWDKLSGRSTFRWIDLFIGSFGSSIIALTVGACVLFFGSNHPLPEQTRPPAAEHIPDEVSNSRRKGGQDEPPESAAWLNSFLHSLWPIVNPALFTAISDMLEDALQATLPSFIHGVRIADLGQGAEPVRILGIRWLDSGDAAEEVDGMKAEEGDFVNLEIGFAYKARSSKSNSLKSRSENAHLLMEFLVAGGMMLPVWVELTGMLSTARLRIQLTPNPPFLSLMTLTLLGQPKITMICTPLAKNFLNVMDIPGLSGWIQRSVDAAVAEYVAPRSLGLDLKTLLMGAEKMDTDAVGVVIVTVGSAKEFKDGDGGKILKSKENRKGQTYVTLGWSKWGKPMWSTRIIKGEGDPVWEETTALLVGPAELNANESLRLQLWDSDRMTADDNLGIVEVPLKDLMGGSQTHNKVSPREDQLRGIDGSPWPGTLAWECGHFSKTTLEQHLAKKGQDAREVERKIEAEAENKFREAKVRDGGDGNGEIEQQKKEDLKEKSDEIIAGSKPTEEWPSGVLSIAIEQIVGLEVEKIKESGVREGGEDEGAGDLPSAYCTVIINHQRVYKTRTKLKSDRPFFDATTEKFIRDWRNTTVMIAVRDARMHEINPLLGVVVLPLPTLFKHHSHINGSFPLVGGIGYGRMHLSLTFRSIQAQLPSRLLGWDVGTLDIEPYIRSSLDLPADLASSRLILRTVYGKGKMVSHQDGGWKQKRDRNVRLAVNKRYASCLLIQFRKHAVGPDKTVAFSTLWLKDIPDNEELTLSLPVYTNESGALERARANSTNKFGEPVGKIELKMRFLPGLSGYHQNSADMDRNMADVMEVLDCAEESTEVNKDLLFDQASDSSTSSSSSSDDEGVLNLNDAKKGVMGEVVDYRKKKGVLHRKHRGLMQWRAARNVAWVGREVEDTGEKIGQKIMGTFKHQDRKLGVEKEV